MVGASKERKTDLHVEPRWSSPSVDLLKPRGLEGLRCTGAMRAIESEAVPDESAAGLRAASEGASARAGGATEG